MAKGAKKTLKTIAEGTGEGIEWQEKTVQKADSNGKVFSRVVKTPVIKTMKEALTVCGNDNDTVLSLLRRAISSAYEATARAAVNAQAGGVDRQLEGAAKKLLAATGADVTDAAVASMIEVIKARLLSQPVAAVEAAAE